MGSADDGVAGASHDLVGERHQEEGGGRIAVLTRHLSKSAAGSFNLAAEHRALMPGVKTVGVTPPQCLVFTNHQNLSQMIARGAPQYLHLAYTQREPFLTLNRWTYPR